jgi:dual specificity phosphatase 12
MAVAVFLCIGECGTPVELRRACSTFSQRQRMPFLAFSPSSKTQLAPSAQHCIPSTLNSCFTRVLHPFFAESSLSSCISPSRCSPHTARLPLHSPSHSYQSANHNVYSSAMGKSRSATVVIAYLMQEHSISPSEALSHLRRARSICEPNDGFMKQLELYGQMQTPEDVEQTPAYQRWVYQREIELSRACGQAPEADKIRFEDEHVTDESAGFELRCRKCRCVTPCLCFDVTGQFVAAVDSAQRSRKSRRPLATSQYLLDHKSSAATSDNDAESPPLASSPNCAHYFLDPLSWMRPELEQGKLDGRLECPKCQSNVGKYAWQGMQCSCGEWVLPAISLSKGRIDEARKSTVGIRQPPGSVMAPQQDGLPKQNL